MKKQNIIDSIWKFCCLLIAMSMAVVGAAAEKSLTGTQIKELLSDKTAHGVHYGKRTTQYFSASGTTSWKGEGDEKSSGGEWKTEDEKYCSRFPDYGNKWGCYQIALDEAQGIYYFLGEDFRAPFIVKEGNSMF